MLPPWLRYVAELCGSVVEVVEVDVVEVDVVDVDVDAVPGWVVVVVVDWLADEAGGAEVGLAGGGAASPEAGIPATTSAVGGPDKPSSVDGGDDIIGAGSAEAGPVPSRGN